MRVRVWFPLSRCARSTFEQGMAEYLTDIDATKLMTEGFLEGTLRDPHELETQGSGLANHPMVRDIERLSVRDYTDAEEWDEYAQGRWPWMPGFVRGLLYACGKSAP